MIVAIAGVTRGIRAVFETSSFPSSAGPEADGVRVAPLVAWGLDDQGGIVGLVIDELDIKPATDFELVAYLTDQE